MKGSTQNQISIRISVTERPFSVTSICQRVLASQPYSKRATSPPPALQHSAPPTPHPSSCSHRNLQHCMSAEHGGARRAQRHCRQLMGPKPQLHHQPYALNAYASDVCASGGGSGGGGECGGEGGRTDDGAMRWGGTPRTPRGAVRWYTTWGRPDAACSCLVRQRRQGACGCHAAPVSHLCRGTGACLSTDV